MLAVLLKMKALRILGISIVAVILIGCAEKPEIIIHTSKTPMAVFVDDVFIGATPLELTASDLTKFGLPEYEEVSPSATSHWSTWDIGSEPGTAEIAHPESRERIMRLHFRASESVQSDVPIAGFTKEKSPGDGTILTFRLKMPVTPLPSD